jgi:hypothetical protein
MAENELRKSANQIVNTEAKLYLRVGYPNDFGVFISLKL